jgi:hypothetical protein
MSILEKTLNQSAQARALVELYRDHLSGDALVCRVLRLSGDIVVVAKIDEHRRPDGVAACRISDITRVRAATDLLQVDTGLVKWSNDLALSDLAFLELTGAATVFNRTFGHVVLYTEKISDRISFIGEEIAVDDDFLLLREFGTLEELDRSEFVLRHDEITRVEADGIYARQLVQAHRVLHPTTPGARGL